MVTHVVDRSVDGSLFQVACDGCGQPLDWLTGVELTAMAIKGCKHLCVDCDGGSDCVHGVLLIDGCKPDVYIVEVDSALTYATLQTPKGVELRLAKL